MGSCRYCYLYPSQIPALVPVQSRQLLACQVLLEAAGKRDIFQHQIGMLICHTETDRAVPALSECRLSA